jgi:hypothetical protein
MRNIIFNLANLQLCTGVAPQGLEGATAACQTAARRATAPQKTTPTHFGWDRCVTKVNSIYLMLPPTYLDLDALGNDLFFPLSSMFMTTVYIVVVLHD